MTPHSQRLDYVPALTGLRGVAVAGVVAYHLYFLSGRPPLVVLGYPLHALAACGYLGVDLFFVLSAFLLSQPFLAAAAGRRAWPRLATYFMRRALRVVPAFWVQIVLLFVIGWLATGAPPFDAHTAVAFMLFAQYLTGPVGTINSVYWSLPVEWWFYFCIPLIGWSFGRARWWLLLALFVVLAVAFRLRCWEWLRFGNPYDYGNILLLRARLDEFFLGVLAAWAHLHVSRESKARALAAAIGVGALLALLPSLAARGDLFADADYPWLLVHYDAVGAPLAMIVFGVAAGGRVSRSLLANRAILWLGGVSYSLYLWHYPVIDWSWRSGLWQRLPRLAAAAGDLAVALLIAWISYRLIERRFVRD